MIQSEPAVSAPFQVKLSDNFPGWPLERQTPGASGAWDDFVFHRNTAIDSCDAWVVIEDLAQPETVLCPAANTIFCAMEPESVRSYDAAFLNQFAVVVTCQTSVLHREVRIQQQAQPWNLGIVRHPDGRVTSDLDFDSFVDTCYPKSKLLSVASTRKMLTDGHVRRVRFIQELKAVLGEKLDVHWLGPETTTDKREAILPYRYHIVLENSAYPHYWTEKLADCYLGNAFPIYYGCPNLSSYFPEESFTPIRTDDAKQAAETIEKLLQEGWTSQREFAMKKARELVLTRYNLYPMLADLIRQRPPDAITSVTLKPQSHFTPTWKRFGRAVRRTIGNVLTARQ